MFRVFGPVRGFKGSSCGGRSNDVQVSNSRLIVAKAAYMCGALTVSRGSSGASVSRVGSKICGIGIAV